MADEMTPSSAPSAPATSSSSAPAPAATTPSAAGAAATPDNGMSVEERSMLAEWERYTKDLKPSELYEFLQLAGEGARAKQEKLLKSQEKLPAREEPKPSPTPSGPSAAELELDRLRKDFEAMKLEREQASAAERQKQQQEEFVKSVRAAVKADDELDDDDADEILDSVTGKLAWHRNKHGDRMPFDPKIAAQAAIEKFKARIEKHAAAKKRQWIDGKIRARAETAGETGRGSPKAREEYKGSGEDFNSGELDRKIKEQLGLT